MLLVCSYGLCRHASARKIKFRNKQAVIDYCSKHIELYCTQQIAWLPQKPYTRIHWANETAP